MKCADLDDARFMELLELAMQSRAELRRRRLVDECGGDGELAAEIVAHAECGDRMGDFLLHPLGVRPRRAKRFAPGALVADRF